jgi:hypothetical protein
MLKVSCLGRQMNDETRQTNSHGPRDWEGLLDLHVSGFYWRERGETRIRNRGAANSETNPDDSTKRPEWLGIRECRFLDAPSAVTVP